MTLKILFSSQSFKMPCINERYCVSVRTYTWTVITEHEAQYDITWMYKIHLAIFIFFNLSERLSS